MVPGSPERQGETGCRGRDESRRMHKLTSSTKPVLCEIHLLPLSTTITTNTDIMEALQAKSCIANALRCQIPPTHLASPLAALSILRTNQHAKLQAPSVTFHPRRWMHQTGSMIPPRPPSGRRISARTPFRPPIQPFTPAVTGGGRRGQATTSQHYHSPVEPIIHPVFETGTSTFQYIVADPETKSAAIIDPVLDYDNCTRTITTSSADALLSLVDEKEYTVVRILETHAHADHLTASFYLQRRLSEKQGQAPPVSIGKRIGRVQSLFGQRYGIDAAEYEGVFDELLEDDQQFDIGNVRAQALHLPGHTPDHLGYRIGGMSAPRALPHPFVRADLRE